MKKIKLPKLSERWTYNEFQQVGKDYTDLKEVKYYDESHAQFRDAAAEANETLDKLNLPKGATVIDYGCGTGAFEIEAAKRGLHVHAVDVSETMLAYAKQKAEQAGALENITFHHAGFLTFEPSEQVDAITTTYAFHHLPDYWKGIALKRMHTMLKPGGTLHMHDVILQEEGSLQLMQAAVDEQYARGGDFLREDIEGHFREEYSTYDWVMDGLFQRAGFSIDQKEILHGIIGLYLCRV